MMLSSVRPLVAALFVTATLPVLPDAGAQTPSTLTGTIRDGSGAIVAGGTLALDGAGLLGEKLVAATNALGRYRFPNLPPGFYELTASGQNLGSVTRTVRVPIGSTLVLDFVLDKAEASAKITLVNAGPMIDVTSPASTPRLTTADLENLPIEGGIAVLQAAAAVPPRAAFGSGSDTKQLTVDGGPATFLERNRARSAAVHVYWMDEIQVVGLGATAEDGEFSSIVANVALRSGSNRVSGLLEHRISPSGWVGDNTRGLQEPLRTSFQPQEILSRWGSHAQVGGPFTRDRLFFFGGFDYRMNKVVQAGTIGNVPFEERSPAVLTKLTWTPRRSLRVDGFVEDDRTRERGAIGRNSLPEVANDRTWRVRSWNARASSTVSPHTLLEFRSGAMLFNFVGIPAARRVGPAPHRDTVTGIRSGNVSAFQDEFGRRYVTSATMTRFLEDFGGWSHTFRSSVEVERTSYDQASGYPAGRSYTDAAGAPEMVELWDGDRITGTGTRTTLVAQDAWSLASRITIHPGVRVGVNRGSVPDKGTVFRTAPLSPRIGIAWDVSTDHTTVVRGDYGRFHEGLYTPLFDFMNTAGRNPRITARVVGPETFVETNRTTVADSVAVDDALAHAFVDQYLLGVERELPADFSVAVQYVGRRFGDIWALTDTGSQYAPVERRDPGPDGRLNTADDGGFVAVFELLNPAQSFSRLTNPEGAYRRYHAIQAMAQKRFSRTWQLLGSYTRSTLRGNVDAGAGDNRASGNETDQDGGFFNPNRRSNADGPSAFDYTHQFNVQGMYVVPAWGGVNVSGSYRFLSGGAAGRTATITGLQQGNQTVRIEPRGTRRIDGASAIDARIEKT